MVYSGSLATVAVFAGGTGLLGGSAIEMSDIDPLGERIEELRIGCCCLGLDLCWDCDTLRSLSSFCAMLMNPARTPGIRVGETGGPSRSTGPYGLYEGGRSFSLLVPFRFNDLGLLDEK